MPEFLEEFLSWYLAPWRRIDRKTFGIALTLATVPSIVIFVASLVGGFGSSGGGFLDPIMGLMGHGGGSDQQVMSNMSNTDLQLQVEKMRGSLGGGAAGGAPAAAEPVAPWHIDWGGLINNLCLLAMVPLSRMRLRDMGWFGWQEVVLSVVFNISVVEGLIQNISGFDLLPYGTLWGFLNFGGYAWLTMAKGQPRQAVFERVPGDGLPPHDKTGPNDERY